MDNNTYKNVLIEILQQSLKSSNSNTALNTLKELKNMFDEKQGTDSSDALLKELETMPMVVIKSEPCYKCGLLEWFDRYAHAKDFQYITIGLHRKSDSDGAIEKQSENSI